jgi:hypothetical protein
VTNLIPIITVPDTGECFCGAAEDPDQATMCTCAEHLAADREEAQYAAEEEAGCYYPGPMEWER